MSKLPKTVSAAASVAVAAVVVALMLGGCGGGSSATPSVTLNGASAAGTLTVSNSGASTLSGTASFASTVTVQIDSGAAQHADLSGTNWQIISTLSNGAHSVVVTSLDASGNAIASGAFSVTNSASPPSKPTVAITFPAPGQVYIGATGAITAAGTSATTSSDAITSVRVRVSGGTWMTATGTTAWTQAATLRSGSNVVDAQAFTASGASDVAGVTCTYNPLP
jgi:hypothetical protein